MKHPPQDNTPCKECGTLFTAKWNQGRKQYGKYCSLKCRSRIYSATMGYPYAPLKRA